MPGEMKICKTCGKEYEACRTPNPNGTFRWRDVGCSIECAREYMRKIMIARGELKADEWEEKPSAEPVVVSVVQEGAEIASAPEESKLAEEPVEEPAPEQEETPEEVPEISYRFSRRKKK